MSTTTGRPAGLRLERVRIAHPDAALLIADVQAEYVVRYGSPDQTPYSPHEFDAPQGAFFVGYLEDRPVAMGAWRFRPDVAALGGQRAAEVKRMFVAAGARRGGLARVVLRALEDDARAMGADVMILETGTAQPEAMAFYEDAGYSPIPGFGYYAYSHRNRCYARVLD